MNPTSFSSLAPRNGDMIKNINGILVREVDVQNFPFGNSCNHCVFKGTACYDDLSFSCHGDSRGDGCDVVFVKVGDLTPTDLFDKIPVIKDREFVDYLKGI